MNPCIYEFQKDQESFRIVEEPMSLADSREFCGKFNETLANLNNTERFDSALGHLNNCLKTVDEYKIAYRELKLYRIGFPAEDEIKSLAERDIFQKEQRLEDVFGSDNNNFVIGRYFDQITALKIDDSEKWPFICSKENPVMAEALKFIDGSFFNFSESSYEAFNSYAVISSLIGCFFMSLIVVFVVWFCKKRSIRQSKEFV